MISKNCLIIDDEDQSVQITKLKNMVRDEGYELICNQINPNDYVIDDSSSEDSLIDKDKLLSAIKKEIRSGVMLIACDNNINDSLKGYELLFLIRNSTKYKYEFILYSGGLDVLINDIFNTDEKYSKAKQLVEARITKFLHRNTTYIEDIKGVICKQSFDLRRELLHWLSSFEEMQIEKGHPDFKNIKLGDIIEAINEDTNLGIKFQKLLVEQGVSMFIDFKLPNYE